ncbi:hypothetical protein ACLKA7_006424 [Drosophila subpalustris]
MECEGTSYLKYIWANPELRPLHFHSSRFPLVHGLATMPQRRESERDARRCTAPQHHHRSVLTSVEGLATLQHANCYKLTTLVTRGEGVMGNPLESGANALTEFSNQHTSLTIKLLAF